ncbi:MAG TPA: hypothetical protein VH475_17090 [Tepidisphaeraceae bacterium]|jgi:hypothetical protein
MERLLRIMQSVGVAISLLICLAVALLWLGGYPGFTKCALHLRPTEPITQTTFRVGTVASRIFFDIERTAVEESPKGFEFPRPGFAMESGPPSSRDVPDLIPQTGQQSFWGTLGFAAMHRVNRDREIRNGENWIDLSHGPLVLRDVRRVWLPCWIILAAMGALAVLILRPVIRAMRRGNRLTQTHCSTCGYDLRATPERCPECGSVAREVAS